MKVKMLNRKDIIDAYCHYLPIVYTEYLQTLNTVMHCSWKTYLRMAGPVEGCSDPPTHAGSGIPPAWTGSGTSWRRSRTPSAGTGTRALRWSLPRTGDDIGPEVGVVDSDWNASRRHPPGRSPENRKRRWYIMIKTWHGSSKYRTEPFDISKARPFTGHEIYLSLECILLQDKRHTSPVEY